MSQRVTLFDGLGKAKRRVALSARRKRAAKKPSMPCMTGSSPKPWQGSVRSVPAGVRRWPRPAISSASIGLEREFRMAREEGRDLRLALLRLERAGAIDEHARPASPARRRGRASSPAAPRASAMSSGCFSQGMSGWRRIVPVAEQGASSSTASNFSAGSHSRRSAATSSRLEAEAAEVLGEPLQPVLRDVDAR